MLALSRRDLIMVLALAVALHLADKVAAGWAEYRVTGSFVAEDSRRG